MKEEAWSGLESIQLATNLEEMRRWSEGTFLISGEVQWHKLLLGDGSKDNFA